MVRQVEMLVENEAGWACDVMPVGIKTQVCQGFALPDVLGKGAFKAMAQIYAILATAVKLVSTFGGSICSFAIEGFLRAYLSAT